MINFIKKYALAIVAVVTIVSFSAFKISNSNAAFATVPIYFHGNPANAAEVADESNWTIFSNGQTCDETPNLACMMLVDHTDLTGVELDSTKVTLEAILGASALGYIPDHIGGSGTPDPTIVNKT